MAARPFVKPDALESMRIAARSSNAAGLSKTLIQKIEDRLKTETKNSKARAILLGAWSRDQLCPSSDLDLLFFGDENDVHKIVEGFQADNIVLRYRVPKNPEDWSENVLFSDLLSLWMGRALDPKDNDALQTQKEKVKQAWLKNKKLWLSNLLEERKSRHEKFGNEPGLLELNIKAMPGGTRDCVQALTLIDFFELKSELFQSIKKEIAKNLDFLIWVRQRLHFLERSDRFHAQAQLDFIAEFTPGEELKPFMKKVHLALMNNHLFCEAVLEEIQNKKSSPYSARETVKVRLFGSDAKHNILKLFSIKNGFAPLKSFFLSGEGGAHFPEWKKLEGLIQTNQYHRLTADAHTLELIETVFDTHKNSKWLRGAKAIADGLNEEDWSILLWSAFFHDLCKGQKIDHEILGERSARKHLEMLKANPKVIDEVAWIVRNHLILSQAAFRQNPKSPTTWEQLHAQDVKGKRLDRLLIFTCMDIWATNPEAWNDWKADLLVELAENLRSVSASRYLAGMAETQKAGHKKQTEWLKAIDPTMLEKLSEKALLKDFNDFQKTKKDLPVRVVRSDRQHLWVRFHKKNDEQGLFRQFVGQLFSAGCNISEAFVYTIDGLGVYDWFKVKSKKTPQQLQKLLSHVSAHSGSNEYSKPKVDFDSIKLMSLDEKEGVISFRGTDQKGALVAAAEALFEVGLVIRWARVHTWGKTIDDVFGVASLAQLPGLVASLNTVTKSGQTKDAAGKSKLK